jgi:phospholipase C
MMTRPAGQATLLVISFYPATRVLLKAGLVAGAVAGAGAWSPADASAIRSGWNRKFRKPGSLPYPKLPMGTDTIPQIEHIVILMMENHSYDNKLGMLRRCGADGFRLGHDGKPLATNPYANGYIQHPFRGPSPPTASRRTCWAMSPSTTASTSTASGCRWRSSRPAGHRPQFAEVQRYRTRSHPTARLSFSTTILNG